MTNYIKSIEWARDHEGAMSFLVKLNREDPDTIERITEGLLINPRIRGKQLFNLWILAGRDMQKMAKLCDDCPNDIMEKACYSHSMIEAKELIKPYL